MFLAYMYHEKSFVPAFFKVSIDHWPIWWPWVWKKKLLFWTKVWKSLEFISWYLCKALTVVKKKDQLGIFGSKAGMVKQTEKDCYQACPIGSLENFDANAGVWRLRITFTVNATLKHVAKLSLYLSFNVYLSYSKEKKFIPGLSVRIISSDFICWFPNLSNCNISTWCFDVAVNVILRFPIDRSDRGSNFYETKFMDCSSRWEGNQEI